jgi:Xaa-Pro aminopeptidase
MNAITSDEYRVRLDRVRDAMSAARLDALVAYANKTHPGHVRYLTGYETRLGIHDSAVCVVTPARCTLLTNASFDMPQARPPLDEVVITSNFGTAVTALLPTHVRTLGIAGFAALPAPVFIALRERLPQATISDASELLLALRQIKSPAEIALLREASRITDAGGRAFLEWARPGVSERELLVRVEAALKRSGSDEVSFSTQICSGLRTAQVVAFAGDVELAEGMPVQLDCGATCQGYRGDLSRMVFLGRPSGRLRDLMVAAAEIYDRCLEMLRPGVSCAEVARLAVEIAERQGLGRNLYRSPNHEAGFVGHGIGCSYSEPPELHPANEAVLRENMVIVLEPIVSDPAVGGVKLEDPVLITSAGPQRLSALPVRSGEWPQ